MVARPATPSHAACLDLANFVACGIDRCVDQCVNDSSEWSVDRISLRIVLDQLRGAAVVLLKFLSAVGSALIPRY
jgi:hypothetical protein